MGPAAPHPPPPPEVASPEAFLSSLLNILSMLTEQPQAIVQWLSLARTVLTIATEQRAGGSALGWHGAMDYAHAILRERTHTRLPLAPANAMVIGELLMNSVLAAQRAGPGPEAPAGAAAVNQACRNWNYVQCMRPSCPRMHHCLHCSADHRVIACPQAPPGIKTSYPRDAHGRAVRPQAGSSIATASVGRSKAPAVAAAPTSSASQA